MKKIFVIGSYGAGNIGDEAIAHIIKTQLGKKYQIHLAIPHLPFRWIHIPFRLPTIWKLIQSDIVLIGGGGLFTDNDTIKAIKIWKNTINWAAFFGKKIILYANSIGPFETQEAKHLTQQAFKKIHYFSTRDAISHNTLTQLGFSGECYTDPVFAFPAVPSNTNKKKIIFLSFRITTHTKKGENIFFPGLLDYLNKKKTQGYRIEFISMEKKDIQSIPNCYLPIIDAQHQPNTYQQLLTLLQQGEISIGMRLHFLIASAIANNQMLAISYSTKVQGIMEQIAIALLEKNDDHLTITKKITSPKNLSQQIAKVKQLHETISQKIEDFS